MSFGLREWLAWDAVSGAVGIGGECTWADRVTGRATGAAEVVVSGWTEKIGNVDCSGDCWFVCSKFCRDTCGLFSGGCLPSVFKDFLGIQ